MGTTRTPCKIFVGGQGIHAWIHEKWRSGLKWGLARELQICTRSRSAWPGRPLVRMTRDPVVAGARIDRMSSGAGKPRRKPSGELEAGYTERGDPLRFFVGHGCNRSAIRCGFFVARRSAAGCQFTTGVCGAIEDSARILPRLGAWI